jgi:hypothetical protein
MTILEHFMKSSILSLAGAALIALASGSAAQFEQGGGIVDLRIDGQLPSSNAGHQVPTSSSYTLSITDGATTRPFVLLADTELTAGGLVIPSVGSIDMDTPQILMNGIFPASFIDLLAHTDLSVSITITPGSTPSCTVVPSFAFQAIALDPAGSPLPYTMTQAGQAVQSGVVTTIANIGDDAFVTWTPTCPSTPGAVYAGTTYSTMFVESNGYICFGAGQGNYGNSPLDVFDGFAAGSPNPGVAVWASDYADASAVNPSGDTIVIKEIGATVSVEWRNQEFYGGNGTSAGTFSVTFDPSDVVILDLSQALSGDYSGFFDYAPVVGVTDGDITMGTDSILDLSANIGYTTQTGNAPESIVEEFTADFSSFDLATVSFFHLGGYSWLIQ